jgi:serine/threonine protein kinase
MLNIPTPKPLAFIEQRIVGIIWSCYFLTEYEIGQSLHNFLKDSYLTDNHRKQTVKEVTELLNNMGKHRISHGDLKHSNIIITDKGPKIIDLDAITVHKCNWTYKIRYRKSMLRFTNDLQSAYSSTIQTTINKHHT